MSTNANRKLYVEELLKSRQEANKIYENTHQDLERKLAPQGAYFNGNPTPFNKESAEADPNSGTINSMAHTAASKHMDDQRIFDMGNDLENQESNDEKIKAARYSAIQRMLRGE